MTDLKCELHGFDMDEFIQLDMDNKVQSLTYIVSNVELKYRLPYN